MSSSVFDLPSGVTVENCHEFVPADRSSNLEYRRRVLEACFDDVELQKVFRDLCRGNLIFWVNTFCWTYDPRFSSSEDRVVPFISYPFQVKILGELFRSIGRQDVTIEKSRDMGLTWMCILTVDHGFLFHRRSTFMCVSRIEELVDRPEDPDTLFWKFDFIHEHLPSWMLPRLKRSSKHIYNMDLSSTIDGAACTGNMGAGGRRTAFFLDEFSLFPVDAGFRSLAATQMNTRCRIFNGTPKGSGNAHYMINHPPSLIRKLRAHWSEHPVQSRGLYTSEDSRVRILDESFWRNVTMGNLRRDFPLLMADLDNRHAGGEVPDDSQPAKEYYFFKTDGKLRSPYYDNECLRTPIAAQISQELDIDYIGAGESIISQAEITRLVTLHGRNPVKRGEFVHDDVTGRDGRFVEDPGGSLRLWFDPGVHGRAPRDVAFVIGVDVALGSSYSNSCVVVASRGTNECVAEYVSNLIAPDELARLVFALGMWFGESLVIWEDNGVGAQFREHLRRLGYPNLYRRRVDNSTKSSFSDKLGFSTTAASKKFILMNCVSGMKRGEYINRSIDGIHEFGYYQHASGMVVHSSTLMSIGPGSSHKENHGDRAIAHSLVYHVLKDEVMLDRQKRKIVPPNCYFARRQEWEKKDREKALAGWGV